MIRKCLFFLGIIFLGLSCQAQILFKIEGNGLSAPSYLLGTHHLAPLSIIDSIVGCRTAFRECDQIVGEIDMTQDPMSLAMSIQQFTIAPPDSTLSKVIDSKDFKRIKKEFRKWAPMQGMDLEMLDMMKPMVINAMVNISMSKSLFPQFNESEQLDSYFQIEGKKYNKRIIGLETPEFQAQTLYGFEPILIQAKDLIKLLDNPEKAMDAAKRLNQAYMSQNLTAIEKMAEEDDKEESKAFTEALIDKRNENWLAILPSIFQQGSTFVAVGAMHLVGENGLIEGLKKSGYNVQPVIHPFDGN